MSSTPDTNCTVNDSKSIGSPTKLPSQEAKGITPLILTSESQPSGTNKPAEATSTENEYTATNDSIQCSSPESQCTDRVSVQPTTDALKGGRCIYVSHQWKHLAINKQH